VRSDESLQRSKYQRLDFGEKHTFQVNAEVIRDWNTSEVFLYLFYRNLLLNKGYRYGLSRIGCSICPFNSSWSESLIRKIYVRTFEPYIKELRSLASNLGIDSSKVNEYIAQGEWKKRAGSEGTVDSGKYLDLSIKIGKLTVVMKRPSENFLEWIKAVGEVIHKEAGGTLYGEIRVGDKIYAFDTKRTGDKLSVHIDTHGDKLLESKLKRVAYKATYCVHCGACEIECPTGALSVIPTVKIDNSLCTHCGNCLDIAERGCLVAKSLQMAEGGRNMKKQRKLRGFGRYLTFGMREEWLLDFLSNLDDWFENNNLGNKQLDSMKAWLLDAELIDKKKQHTQLAYILSEICSKNKNLIWEIVWVNLYYNSSPCKVFTDYIEWSSSLRVGDFMEIVYGVDESLSERTIKSGISSLLNMFENSPLGKELKIGVIEKKGRERYVKKIGTDDIHPLAVAYSLYKAAEYIGRRDFTISELYSKEFKGGPYKLFGISRDKLERVLRGLQEDKEQILRVDLVADLDNIYLRDDLSSLDIVKIAEARLK